MADFLGRRYPAVPDNPDLLAYGTGNEPYMRGGVVPTYKGRDLSDPQTLLAFDRGTDVGQRFQPDMRRGQNNARAQVAANRSALVGLGLDPQNTWPIGDAEFWGVTKPESGRMLLDPRTPAAASHEAVHNSLRRMASSPRVPEGIKRTLADPSTHEQIARSVMLRNFGDVERQEEAQQGFNEREHPQIGEARELLGDPKWTAFLDYLEKLAQREVATRRPGGPR
jgi:hypothetical protein